jgi:hypothetical protein
LRRPDNPEILEEVETKIDPQTGHTIKCIKAFKLVKNPVTGEIQKIRCLEEDREIDTQTGQMFSVNSQTGQRAPLPSNLV